MSGVRLPARAVLPPARATHLSTRRRRVDPPRDRLQLTPRPRKKPAFPNMAHPPSLIWILLATVFSSLLGLVQSPPSLIWHTRLPYYGSSSRPSSAHSSASNKARLP
eukprot:2552084-Prymnesium_polylepis.1